MFLLSVTKNENSNLFEKGNLFSDKIEDLCVLILADDTISRIITEGDSYTIYSSPKYINDEKSLFKKIDYNQQTKEINAYCSFLSGSPIYYYQNINDGFYVSDSLLLLSRSGVPLIENYNVLPEYFSYGEVFPPRSFYKNIYVLQNGYSLNLRIEKKKLNIKTQVIDSLDNQKTSLNESIIISDVSNKIIEALGLIGSKKNVIYFLFSGGLDSSILFKYLEHLGFKFLTYSSGYSWEDPNFEKDYAFSAAESFGVKHEYFDMTEKDFPPSLIKTIYNAGVPLPNIQSVVMNKICADFLPKDRNIVINGNGGELLGYNGLSNTMYEYSKSKNYYILNFLEKNINPLYTKWKKYLKFYPNISCDIMNPEHILWKLRSDNEWVTDYFNINKKEIIQSRLQLLQESPFVSIYDVVQYTGLLEDMYTNSLWGKIGNVNNRIIYFPFSYPSLVKYAFKIPDKIMYKTPAFIRESLARKFIIPESIINRKKMGFNPITNVPKNFFDPLIKISSNIIESSEMEKMKSFKWNDNRFWTLWHMINYSIWKRIWIQKENVEDLAEELEV